MKRLLGKAIRSLGWLLYCLGMRMEEGQAPEWIPTMWFNRKR